MCVWKLAGFSFVLGNMCFRNQPVSGSLVCFPFLLSKPGCFLLSLLWPLGEAQQPQPWSNSLSQVWCAGVTKAPTPDAKGLANILVAEL